MRPAATAACLVSVSASFVLGFASACTSTPRTVPRALAPANDALKARVLAAWDEALRRADSLGPARLLYDAKFGRGAVKLPGTLTVYAGLESLTLKAAGPFGVEVGSYDEGTYRAKGAEAAFLDPAVLRGVLAGVWRGGTPEVSGADSEEGLLRWSEAGGVAAEARLDLSAAHLRSLEVRGRSGEISAEFSGSFDPWPEEILLLDQKSGRSLKLKRVAVEAIKDEL